MNYFMRFIIFSSKFHLHFVKVGGLLQNTSSDAVNAYHNQR